MSNPTFAHHADETDEQHAEHVAALETELEGQQHRAEHADLDVDKERGKARISAINAELSRLRGGASTRLRGAGKSTRAEADA